VSGGTFCRFLVGRPGQGNLYLRYILRPEAIGPQSPALWTRLLPEPILAVASPEALSRSLLAYVWAREACERGSDPRETPGRTYYSAVLGFERPLPTEDMRLLVSGWLDACFPRQPSIAVLHQNTDHRHVHVWIAARGIDGLKLDLDAAQYRQLDERWNRLYAPALGHDEREHLCRKWDWEARKRLYRDTLRAGRERESAWTLRQEAAYDPLRWRPGAPNTPSAHDRAHSEPGEPRPASREPAASRNPRRHGTLDEAPAALRPIGPEPAEQTLPGAPIPALEPPRLPADEEREF
jgi:hypothetical protein